MKQEIQFTQGSSFTKIRPQAEIDNFAFKNSNIIIEGLIWKRNEYFSWKKFEFIFLGKRFSTTWPFPIFEIELIIIKYSNLFIKMLFGKIVFL